MRSLDTESLSAISRGRCNPLSPKDIWVSSCSREKMERSKDRRASKLLVFSFLFWCATRWFPPLCEAVGTCKCRVRVSSERAATVNSVQGNIRVCWVCFDMITAKRRTIQWAKPRHICSLHLRESAHATSVMFVNIDLHPRSLQLDNRNVFHRVFLASCWTPKFRCWPPL